MAQIPELPIDEPVARPKAKPQLFGQAGGAIAELGAETEQIAQQNIAFEGHLLYAQRQLKAAQAEIELDKVKAQVHDELSRATTPEQAQEIGQRAQGDLDNAVSQYQNDPVLAREINIHKQREAVELQSTVNTKRAQIISRNSEAAIGVLGSKHAQTAINIGAAGGDPKDELSKFDYELQGFVSSGAISSEKAEAISRQLKHDVQMGIITAKSNSPVQSVREDTVKQLAAGGGSFDRSLLSEEEMGTLYKHAIEANNSLTERERAASLQNGINSVESVFAGEAYRHPDGTRDFDAIGKALDSSQFLLDNNIKNPDGTPNYIMADELRKHYAGVWNFEEKAQKNKDDQIVEEYSPRLYGVGKPLSITEIESLPQTKGASSRAVNMLKSNMIQWQNHQRELQIQMRGLALAERQQKQRELEDTSKANYRALLGRMANLEPIDYNKDILEPVSKGEMTHADADEAWRQYKQESNLPDLVQGKQIVMSAFASLPNTPENNRKAIDAVNSLRKSVQEKKLSGGAVLDEANKIAKDIKDRGTYSWINTIVGAMQGVYIPPGKSPAQNVKPIEILAPNGKTYTFKDQASADAFKKDAGIK